MRLWRLLDVPREVIGSPWRRRAVAAGAGVALAAGVVVAAAGPAVAGGAPGLAFTPSPYDYGTVIVGQTPSQTFMLANSGSKASGRLQVSLSGSSEFTVTADTCSGTSLGPNKSCNVTVQFAPTGDGMVTATLTAANNKKAVLATDTLTGTGLVPGPHIYWADLGGTVNEANLDGSNPVVIASGSEPTGVAVDSTNVFWTDQGNGTIVEANLDGTNPHVVVSGQNFPQGLAVDSTNLYWTTPANNSVWEANLDGSNAHVIVSGQNFPIGVVVNSSNLYWADDANTAGEGTIMEANLDGSNAHAVVSGLNFPYGVALNSSNLYFTTPGDGNVWEANLDGSSPHVIGSGSEPSGIAVDSTNLYWVDLSAGTATEANLDGSGAHTIETGQAGPSLMTVGPQ